MKNLKQSNSFKYIPFTDKKYRVYKNGNVYSEFSSKFINGRKISGNNPRLQIDVLLDKENRKLNLTKNNRVSILIHRLVYFLYKYDSNGTIQDFMNMPLIYHKDSNIINNKLSNLQIMYNRKDLGIWSNKVNPRTILENLRPSVTSILDTDKKSINKLLKENKSYPYIGKLFGYSDMVIYRYAKANNLQGTVRNKNYNKITEKMVLSIRRSKLSNIQLAKKFKINVATVSRIKNHHTYKNI